MLLVGNRSNWHKNQNLIPIQVLDITSDDPDIFARGVWIFPQNNKTYFYYFYDNDTNLKDFETDTIHITNYSGGAAEFQLGYDYKNDVLYTVRVRTNFSEFELWRYDFGTDDGWENVSGTQLNDLGFGDPAASGGTGYALYIPKTHSILFGAISDAYTNDNDGNSVFYLYDITGDSFTQLYKTGSHPGFHPRNPLFWDDDYLYIVTYLDNNPDRSFVRKYTNSTSPSFESDYTVSMEMDTRLKKNLGYSAAGAKIYDFSTDTTWDLNDASDWTYSSDAGFLYEETDSAYKIVTYAYGDSYNAFHGITLGFDGSVSLDWIGDEEDPEYDSQRVISRSDELQFQRRFYYLTENDPNRLFKSNYSGIS